MTNCEITNYKPEDFKTKGIDLQSFNKEVMIERFKEVSVTGINVLILIYKPPVEEVKEEIKPKDYSKEEQEAYHKLVEDINNFFAEIVLRQMNHEEEKPSSANAEGGAPADG